jgi:hypothetical protein
MSASYVVVVGRESRLADSGRLNIDKIIAVIYLRIMY